MPELSEPVCDAILKAVQVLFFPYSYYNRRKLINISKRNERIFSVYIKATEAALTELSKQNYARKGFKTEWELAAAAYFAANLALDLNTAVCIAATSWRKQKRDYIWRTIALTLYEGMIQNSKYVLPVLSKFLKEAGATSELCGRQRSSAKKIAQLFHLYGDYLHEIRNNCIAHREVDYQKFKKIRLAVSEKKIMDCLSEFLQIQAEVQQIFGAAVQKAIEITKDI